MRRISFFIVFFYIFCAPVLMAKDDKNTAEKVSKEKDGDGGELSISDHFDDNYFHFGSNSFELETSNSAIMSEEILERELSNDSEVKSRNVDGSLWLNLGLAFAPIPEVILGSRSSYVYYSEAEVQSRKPNEVNLNGWSDLEYFLAVRAVTFNDWDFWSKAEYRLDAYESSVTKNRHRVGAGVYAVNGWSEGNYFFGLFGNKFLKKEGKRAYHEGRLEAGVEALSTENLFFGVEGMVGFREKRVIDGPGSLSNERVTHEFSESGFFGLKLSGYYVISQNFAVFLNYSMTQDTESDYTKTTYRDGNLVSKTQEDERTDSSTELRLGLKSRF